MELHGRRVVLTGATGTIGRELAIGLSERGARVTIAARSRDALEALAVRTGATPVAVDLATADGPRHLLEAGTAAHGPPDVIVHNAAVEQPGRLEDLDPDALRATVALNVVAPLELTRLVLPAMRARREGHLVWISSLAGVAAFPGLSLYAATKAAMTRAAAGLELDLAGSGVTQTVAELGPVRSAMMDRAREFAPTAAAFGRARTLRVLRDLEATAVATAVLDAVEADRRRVRLPRRAAAFAGVAAAPAAVVRLALWGTRR